MFFFSKWILFWLVITFDDLLAIVFQDGRVDHRHLNVGHVSYDVVDGCCWMIGDKRCFYLCRVDTVLPYDQWWPVGHSSLRWLCWHRNLYVGQVSNDVSHGCYWMIGENMFLLFNSFWCAEWIPFWLVTIIDDLLAIVVRDGRVENKYPYVGQVSYNVDR